MGQNQPPKTSPRYNFKNFLNQYNVQVAPQSVETLQANITFLCNQACRHCHVGASPSRTETMEMDVVDRVLEILTRNDRIRNLDLTGGAPELNPNFDYFVVEAQKIGKHVIVRHNLTVTFDGHPQTRKSMEYLPEFFASQKVEIISSLPYYQPYFTDKQRGNGVFEKSLKSLRILNELGYGKEESGLHLNLVYNPVGAFLPPSQESIESDYRRELRSRFGIVFNNLYTITNMPIFRFRDQLKNLGALDDYWRKLVNAFNPAAARAVMCRKQISIGYDGKLYDCDFNQMLGMQIVLKDPATVKNFDYNAMLNREIQLAPHCFGCTAGAGSSCGGSTA